MCVVEEVQCIVAAGQAGKLLSVVDIVRRNHLSMIRNFLLHTKPRGIVFKLHQLLRRDGVYPRFGGHAAVQAAADDAQDIAVQSVLISGRLHREYAVFKMQGIVCVGFGGSYAYLRFHCALPLHEGAYSMHIRKVYLALLHLRAQCFIVCLP